MARLSRITPVPPHNQHGSRPKRVVPRPENTAQGILGKVNSFLFGPEPGVVTCMMIGPVEPSGALDATQKAKADLANKLFDLTVKSFGREGGLGILAWEVLEKFSNQLPEEMALRISEQRAPRRFLFDPAFDADLAMRAAPLKQLSPTDRAEIVSGFDRFSAAERGQLLTLEFPEAAENLLAYHFYKGTLAETLAQPALPGKIRIRLRIKAAKVQLALGKNEEALSTLRKALEDVAPADCIHNGLLHPFNQLAEALSPLQALAPDLFSAKGLGLIIRNYKEKGSQPHEDSQLVNAGFIYPEETVEKFAAGLPPRASTLLRLGKILFLIKRDGAAAAPKLNAFCAEETANNPELNPRITEIIYLKARELGLLGTLEQHEQEKSRAADQPETPPGKPLAEIYALVRKSKRPVITFHLAEPSHPMETEVPFASLFENAPARERLYLHLTLRYREEYAEEKRAVEAAAGDRRKRAAAQRELIFKAFNKQVDQLMADKGVKVDEAALAAAKEWMDAGLLPAYSKPIKVEASEQGILPLHSLLQLCWYANIAEHGGYDVILVEHGDVKGVQLARDIVNNPIGEVKLAPDIPDLPQEAPERPIAPPMDHAALSLRSKVRERGEPLLFTRNINLAEFQDIVVSNELRRLERAPNYFRYGLNSKNELRQMDLAPKHFRYGLGHEYGEKGAVIVLVMKKAFWDNRKDRGVLKNLFLDEVNGKPAPGRELKVLKEVKDIGNVRLMMDNVVGNHERRTQLLIELAVAADYNRNIQHKEAQKERAKAKEAKALSLAGNTIWFFEQDKYMGHYPQLEVQQNVPLDEVECILVPEHMWQEVLHLAQQNPAVRKLLKKIEGSGKSREEFLRGREKLGRRSRTYGGSFEPNFGYDSFFLFEQQYFRAVLEAEQKDFSSKAAGLMEMYGYHAVPSGWLFAYPKDIPMLMRNERDWKIFVNPREEKFLEVLESILSVLSANKRLGVYFKIPPDLSQEWRSGRKFGNSSSTPKITIYVNAETLPLILKALDRKLRKQLALAGFGKEAGPSFAARYGATDLLFYKKEYAYGPEGDERARVANLVEREQRSAGLGDEAELWRRKQQSLYYAGYRGENFYIKAGDYDPVLKRKLD